MRVAGTYRRKVPLASLLCLLSPLYSASFDDGPPLPVSPRCSGPASNGSSSASRLSKDASGCGRREAIRRRAWRGGRLISRRCSPSPILSSVSGCEPGNRLRADIVAAGYRAQRFTVHVAPLDRFALLMRGKARLAAEFVALGLGVGAAACGAFHDAAAFQLRGNAKDRKNDLGKVR